VYRTSRWAHNKLVLSRDQSLDRSFNFASSLTIYSPYKSACLSPLLPKTGVSGSYVTCSSSYFVVVRAFWRVFFLTQDPADKVRRCPKEYRAGKWLIGNRDVLDSDATPQIGAHSLNTRLD
jgi:hypothetical protein